MGELGLEPDLKSRDGALDPYSVLPAVQGSHESPGKLTYVRSVFIWLGLNSEALRVTFSGLCLELGSRAPGFLK